ncbi:hypothetical protein HX787_29080 [Pseudomonas tolaasii]|uniref:Uncharacterized protein n=2 Tax=Pseudomonas tolaasii TaxID=29442 RepID=A0A7Y8DSM7_PSETO|nr:hypothetical protein [Pseudomonas tolaasii]ARB27438.1 hypothetical protein B5P22_09200 [Pseudomonas tolaasii]KAB0467458.1 hypothetical protein F7R12_25045 [Pseudomonas tolaasii]MBW1250745.1 hypothetical protein [Pseudomonas tolaasii]MBW4791162.1 hypothetical protein [Pseudomonas tolaasii]MBY8943336.1 hypothetical protein [Pseudomonas tolaasii]
MGKQKTVWPTEREVRLRFILFAVIDVASARGAPAELLLRADKLLRTSPTESQLRETLLEILACDEMQGFRFTPGSEAQEFMQALEPGLFQAG